MATDPLVRPYFPWDVALQGTIRFQWVISGKMGLKVDGTPNHGFQGI